MCSMCDNSGADQTESKDCDKKHGNDISLKLNSRIPCRPCKFCGEKLEQEYVEGYSASPYATPLISRTISLSSTDSSVSTCSEFSVDVNSSDRSSKEEGPVDCCMEYPESGTERTDKVMEKSSQENNIHHEGYVVKDVEIAQGHDDQEEKADGTEDSATSFSEETEYSLPDSLDLQTWEPPEPEIPEDDVENSVVCDDDDENEGIDSGNWGEPTLLSHSKNEISGSYRFKEARQRAMEEVINGKFKALVGQLLKSVGVSSSNEGGESWTDIVTSLSWEAASFLKPDAISDNAMNPDGCVKVKCIATGSRSQSQIIKGLVFKKHAAHKHMPSKYTRPRLLLIRGMLGQSSSGLSSFDSMEQEKGYLKSIGELIERCHPNVILVEKTVSRDIQESILAKGMTLVLDMKLHRLERVARCTGAPILSCDNLNGQKLKHCDFIYFEKFLEEHAEVVGGKPSKKTLMFIEGCPTRLGCTILLKGTYSEELKRIKCVLRCAVVMAYHLILETSFLVDQRAMFSTIPVSNAIDVLPANQKYHNSAPSDSIVPSLEHSFDESGLVTADILIASGFQEESINDLNLESEEISPFSSEPDDPVVFSGFSAISSSLKEVIGDSFPSGSSAPYQSLSAYFGFNAKEPDRLVNRAISISETPEEDGNFSIEAKNSDEQELYSGVQSQSLPVHLESNWNESKEGNDDNYHMQSKDGINVVLDSQSILVLMSSRNALRGTICQQSHFSHIMFYKNFDVPFGRFLQDNLLNQTRLCDTCHELPKAHFYYYAHHNKQLTIQVKRLPQEKHLPGEAEGKLWMWGRCGKCKSGSTKRVMISTTARCLSFGKFLELTLTNYSFSNRKSSCGHSPDRDFLYFFGLGNMVSMFRYSLVATYTVSMPPEKLDFSGAIQQEWLKKETEDVYTKGILLFTELAKYLKKIKVQFVGSSLNLGGSIKNFSEIEEMLEKEREEFEMNIKNAVSGNPDRPAYKLLSLNRLMWDLLIESCVWDQRLYSLFSPNCLRVDSHVAEKVMREHSYSDVKDTAGGETGSINKVMEDVSVYRQANVNVASDSSREVNEILTKEIPIRGPDQECNDQYDPSNTPNAQGNLEMPSLGDLSSKRSSGGELSSRGDDSTADINLQVHETSSVSTDIQGSYPIGYLNVFSKSVSGNSPASSLQDSNEWFWKPFADIRQKSIRDVRKRYLPKVESISSYISEDLPTAHQLISEEGTRMHIPLRTDDYIVSDFEGELSSIIACALTVLKDSYVLVKADNEDYKKESGIASKTTESSDGLIHGATVTSPHYSYSSLDSDSVHSTGSPSSEESRGPRAPENHSIEIAFGYAKSLGREKYSVICHYVSQFLELRNWCCPSELDYIASLSRCRSWDAKGGKSKSFFAKTLDDRFIVKEIKKTELESFLGFGPLYFKHMKESFETRSQTCLAKVLGIYQVTKRHIKSGKEVRHDIMVMEKLTYNRDITRQYDLKGALYARYNSAGDGAGDVLLDQNFVNDMNCSPLYVSNTAKRHLQRAVWNDTTFLNSINVMDYSLLVGVDSKRRELVCGIIDYLRQYTWDKHLETWMKSSLVVPKNLLPTVISPKEYKKRFRKFMSTYFFSVPDHWCSKKISYPCKLCGKGAEEDSALHDP